MTCDLRHTRSMSARKVPKLSFTESERSRPKAGAAANSHVVRQPSPLRAELWARQTVLAQYRRKSEVPHYLT